MDISRHVKIQRLHSSGVGYLYFRRRDCVLWMTGLWSMNCEMELQLDALRGGERFHRRIASECRDVVKKGTGPLLNRRNMDG